MLHQLLGEHPHLTLSVSRHGMVVVDNLPSGFDNFCLPDRRRKAVAQTPGDSRKLRKPKAPAQRCQPAVLVYTYFQRQSSLWSQKMLQTTREAAQRMSRLRSAFPVLMALQCPDSLAAQIFTIKTLSLSPSCNFGPHQAEGGCSSRVQALCT